MNGDQNQRDLWTAIAELRTLIGEVRVEVGKIAEWRRTREGVCNDHARQIRDLDRVVDDLSNRVTAGLTGKAILVAVVAALASSVLTAAALWTQVSRAVAAMTGQGG